jgi:hypothetical protein
VEGNGAARVVTDLIALSELSDEPTKQRRGHMGYRSDFSPRLAAVLERLPVRNQTGAPVRIQHALTNADILTLAALQAKSPADLRQARDFGAQYIADIEQALAAFGLSLAGADRVVVGDNATPAYAHLQRLQQWIALRVARSNAEEERVGVAGAAHEITEREVLTDVMLILDGREPTNKRMWNAASDEHGYGAIVTSERRRVTDRASLLSGEGMHVLSLECGHRVRYLSSGGERAAGTVPDALACPICLGRAVPKVQPYP